MPRPRFETLDPERRHRILASAAESFRRGGLYGASLNDILAVAGISKGVFYYYFDDKLDLYATVVDEAVRRFEAVFEERPPVEELSASNFWSSLEDNYRSLFRFAGSNAGVVGLVETLADVRLEDVEQLGFDARCLSWLQNYLERGQTLGLVRSDLPMKVLTQLAASVDTAMGKSLFENPEDGIEMLDERTTQIVDMLRRVLDSQVQFSDSGDVAAIHKHAKAEK